MNGASRQLVMSLFQPRTVQNSLWPSLTITWVFGGASIRVKRLWRIFYALTITVIMEFVNTNGLISNYACGKSTIGFIYLCITYLKIPVSLVSIWFWELKGARAVDNAIIELTKLDEELRNFNLKVNHKKFMWKQFITFGGFIILLSVASSMQHLCLMEEYDSLALQNSWEHLLIILSQHMQDFQGLIVDLLFAMMLEGFLIRFKLVNLVFKQIAESEDRIKVKVFTTSYSPSLNVPGKRSHQWSGKRHLSSQLLMERVNRACRIHRRLLKVAQDLGDAFSVALCSNSLILFPQIALEAVILILLIDTVDRQTFAVWTRAISIIFMAGRLWQVVVSCSNTADEANELGTSLYKIPIEDVAVHNQLQDYSVHLIQRKLRFTAAGIFDIDRILAKSIFCTITKYLIILLQFWKSIRGSFTRG